MKHVAKVFMIEMAGWICLTLTLTIATATLLKIPVGSEFFTFAGNVIMAYVIQGALKAVNSDEDKKQLKPNELEVTPYTQTK